MGRTAGRRVAPQVGRGEAVALEVARERLALVLLQAVFDLVPSAVLLVAAVLLVLAAAVVSHDVCSYYRVLCCLLGQRSQRKRRPSGNMWFSMLMSALRAAISTTLR